MTAQNDARSGTAPGAVDPMRRQALMDVIFRTFGHSRFTQDSPLRPDVWMAYWEPMCLGDKAPIVDLILTPAEGRMAGHVAVALEALLAKAPGPLEDTERKRGRVRKTCCISYSHTTIQAKLTPMQALSAVVALSNWWEQRTKEAVKLDEKPDDRDPPPCGERAVMRAREFMAESHDRDWTVDHIITSQRGSFQFYRFAALASLTLLFRDDPKKAEEIAPRLTQGTTSLRWLLEALQTHMEEALRAIDTAKDYLKEFERLNSDLGSPRIHAATVNRAAGNSVYLSRKTVKMDATHTLFRVNTKDIVWAVIDSGIDARHPAFFKRDKPGEWHERTRINQSYDLTFLRDLLVRSDYPEKAPELAATADMSSVDDVQTSWAAFVKDKRSTQRPMLAHLKSRRSAGLAIGWDILAPLVQIPHEKGLYRPPRNEHGTHVAGILAAGWAADTCPPLADTDEPGMMGACPDMHLVDIRAFDARGEGREDTVIEAIDLIRYLNRASGKPVIQGANLSLSVRHDVQAFGCGQTPVCVACNDLVRSGVVVVAAAGNSGHEGDAAMGSHGQSTRDISITDPGNAELVITVGSTHRHSPHSYGVSYFSSRGPTADGRIKPDLVAPGEKICGPVPLAVDVVGTASFKILDGTSMAAPHVSGVAALLMARNRELIGEPLKIKDILKRTATDLGRIPTFQGAGLVDALRALQSL